MPPATVNRSRRFRKAWSFLRFFAGNLLRRNKDPQYVLCRKGYLSLLELLRLRLQNRTTSTLLGREIGITDSFWYLHSLSEIFSQELYCFGSDTESPYILDCGSNIGLSVIYFKRRFPHARIVAFEPDPGIAALLQRNLHAFHLDDVDVKIKAVWREDTVLRIRAVGGLGGRLERSTGLGEPRADIISVPTDRLRHYLHERVDFPKLDIEGAEAEVLEDCAPLLPNVCQLFVEYHSEPTKEQRLDCILSILRDAGFRVYLRLAWDNLPYPFLPRHRPMVYDLQVNIFAYRLPKSDSPVGSPLLSAGIMQSNHDFASFSPQPFGEHCRSLLAGDFSSAIASKLAPTIA